MSDPIRCKKVCIALTSKRRTSNETILNDCRVDVRSVRFSIGRRNADVRPYVRRTDDGPTSSTGGYTEHGPHGIRGYADLWPVPPVNGS